MPGTRRVLAGIAFVTGLLLPVASYGSSPPTQTPLHAGRSSLPARSAEPESVRSAMSALFNACANWPQEPPTTPATDLAVLRRGTPIDALLCDGIVDPEGRRFPIMMVSLLITAAVLGTFAGAFVASASLFRLLFGSIRQATFAARGVLSSLGHR